MTETFQPQSESFEDIQTDKSAEQATPAARLAYEGLMRLVKCGRFSKEEALEHHSRFFPDEPAK